ncbi:hypothetical protein [Streptomyces sp. NPDC050535]|uniref:hypothetical protein n=1 Tax=Streptomyces sp. NPDC050535 TaxID=3365626 RepID=UPI00379801D1
MSSPGHTARPDLQHVPPQGLTTAPAAEESITWHLHGPDVVYRAARHARIAYTWWGLPASQVERLAALARDLTAAAVDRHSATVGGRREGKGGPLLEAHRFAVTVTLDGDQATVSVIAAACSAPGKTTADVREFAEFLGREDLAGAECTCVALALMTASPTLRRSNGPLTSGP